jgi:hypothetical protein
MLHMRQQHYVSATPPMPAPDVRIPLDDDRLAAWSYDTDYLAGLQPPATPA